MLIIYNMILILGDIYISVDRIKDNAKYEQVKISEERLRVIIHGALHLSGFGDDTKPKKSKMRLLEQYWMNVHQQRK
jgi:probable rRNA maturation factor